MSIYPVSADIAVIVTVLVFVPVIVTPETVVVYVQLPLTSVAPSKMVIVETAPAKLPTTPELLAASVMLSLLRTAVTAAGPRLPCSPCRVKP